MAHILSFVMWLLPCGTEQNQGGNYTKGRNRWIKIFLECDQSCRLGCWWTRARSSRICCVVPGRGRQRQGRLGHHQFSIGGGEHGSWDAYVASSYGCTKAV